MYFVIHYTIITMVLSLMKIVFIKSFIQMMMSLIRIFNLKLFLL